MLNKINKLIMYSMKNKEKEKVLVLKGLKSSLLLNLKEKNPQDEDSVLIKYYNAVLKARVQYKDKANLDKLDFEINILKDFLPKQMTRDEVLIEIIKLKNEGKNTFPLIMKEMSKLTKGKFKSQDLVLLIKENL